MNIWQTIKEYINKKETSEIITRKDLLTLKKYYSNPNSIDTYRNHLTKAGFLEIVSPGKYRKIRNIPENMSVQMITKIAYDDTYIKWFVSLEDRIKLYERKGNDRSNKR